jgi:AICAR transformylase/IMP cyclohydrolase PurH
MTKRNKFIFYKEEEYLLEELQLKYGMNPHQGKAKIFLKNKELPFRVINGIPGYLNMLDALNSWALVKELSQLLNKPVAASFKHVSPAGVGVGGDIEDGILKAFNVEKHNLSPIATAYLKARGGDPSASYGDWIALSETVDELTAEIIKNCVSDGIIAPSYEPKAIEILKQKKKINI